MQTRALLAELFSAIAENENLVELARKELCDHDNFEPFEAFCRLGGCCDGEINEGDIANFCNANAIHCSLTDAALVISQYDENGKGKLAFHEFCSLLLPATNATLRSMAISRDYSRSVPQTAFLAQTLEHALALVFLREIDYHRRIEEIKSELSRKPDFSSLNAFNAIDTGKPKNKIDRYEIRDFVHEHLRWLEEEDLDSIIRRCDTDGDEFLVFSEFDDVVKNAKIVRTIPYIEETLSKPPRFIPILSPPPPPVFSTPIHPPDIEFVYHESPLRYRSPPRIERAPIDYVEEYKYSSPAGRSPLRLSPPPRITSPPRMAYSPPRVALPPRTTSPARRSVQQIKASAIVDVVEAIKDLIFLERDLEAAKQALAYRPDFTLNDAFKIFDFNLTGKINEYDIQEAFKIYNVFISLEEANLLLYRYDVNRDGILRFTELTEMFLPKNLHASNALNDRSVTYPNGYYIEPEVPDAYTRKDFTNVLVLNIKVENQAEFIQQNYARRYWNSRNNRFAENTRYEDSYDGFCALLSDFNFIASDSEIHSLAMRFDSTLF